MHKQHLIKKTCREKKSRRQQRQRKWRERGGGDGAAAEKEAAAAKKPLSAELETAKKAGRRHRRRRRRRRRRRQQRQRRRRRRNAEIRKAEKAEDELAKLQKVGREISTPQKKADAEEGDDGEEHCEHGGGRGVQQKLKHGDGAAAERAQQRRTRRRRRCEGRSKKQTAAETAQAKAKTAQAEAEAAQTKKTEAAEAHKEAQEVEAAHKKDPTPEQIAAAEKELEIATNRHETEKKMLEHHTREGERIKGKMTENAKKIQEGLDKFSEKGEHNAWMEKNKDTVDGEDMKDIVDNVKETHQNHLPESLKKFMGDEENASRKAYFAKVAKRDAAEEAAKEARKAKKEARKQDKIKTKELAETTKTLDRENEYRGLLKGRNPELDGDELENAVQNAMKREETNKSKFLGKLRTSKASVVNSVENELLANETLESTAETQASAAAKELERANNALEENQKTLDNNSDSAMEAAAAAAAAEKEASTREELLKGAVTSHEEAVERKYKTESEKLTSYHDGEIGKAKQALTDAKAEQVKTNTAVLDEAKATVERNKTFELSKEWKEQKESLENEPKFSDLKNDRKVQSEQHNIM